MKTPFGRGCEEGKRREDDRCDCPSSYKENTCMNTTWYCLITRNIEFHRATSQDKNDEVVTRLDMHFLLLLRDLGSASSPYVLI